MSVFSEEANLLSSPYLPRPDPGVHARPQPMNSLPERSLHTPLKCWHNTGTLSAPIMKQTRSEPAGAVPFELSCCTLQEVHLMKLLPAVEGGCQGALLHKADSMSHSIGVASVILQRLHGQAQAAVVTSVHCNTPCIAHLQHATNCQMICSSSLAVQEWWCRQSYRAVINAPPF